MPAQMQENQPRKKPVFFTIGYQGIKPAFLQEAVRSQPHAILVDARYSPRSRNPQWGQSNLKKLFGPEYVHAPGWGNANYRVQGMENVRLADFDGALAQILASGAESVFIMCVCGDPSHCHRSIVAERLTALGYTVSEWPLASGSEKGERPANQTLPLFSL